MLSMSCPALICSVTICGVGFPIVPGSSTIRTLSGNAGRIAASSLAPCLIAARSGAVTDGGRFCDSRSSDIHHLFQCLVIITLPTEPLREHLVLNLGLYALHLRKHPL